MTPEQKRIAIAEACGWMKHPTVEGYWRTPETVASNIRLLGHPNGPWDQDQPPDYINDLNAMHEAEKVLTDEQYHTGYKQTLAMLVGLSGSFRMPSATAAQRAEAFLHTLNLWKE